MTDAEINRDLALAIGYATEDVWQKNEHQVVVRRHHLDEPRWCHFSHRDPTVIWPIAVRYNKMPKLGHSGNLWHCRIPSSTEILIASAETPEKAVAMAVIAMHKER